MHSNRIISIQRRAKRRILALAIIATALAGYGALSALAQEDRPSQLPIEKMSKSPGVKAVGIRLINSSGKSPSELPNAPRASMPFPSAPNPLPTSPFPLPAAMPLPSTSIPSTSIPSTSIPPVPEFPSAPTFTSLPAVPKKSDLQPNQPTGKVLMKLNGAEGNSATSTANVTETKKPTESEPPSTAETVNVRVIQSRGMGQPAKMPPFLVEQSGKRVDAISDLTKPSSSLAAPTVPAAPAAIRMSLGDSIDTASIPPSKNRIPQLVKSKPTQLEHTVTLAHSTEIESRKVNDEPEAFTQSVEVDSSLVPHSISGIGNRGPKSSAPQAVVTGAVLDAIGAIEPPARDLQFDVPSRNKSTSSGVDQSTDNSKRRFDVRPAYQTPVATVDLESLAATTMDLAGRLVAIAVQDENICKVLHNERTISLVGNQVGTTLVQIWTSDLGEKPQVVRVNVSQPGGKQQATTNAVKDIKQVIAQSFPRADVSIITKEDGSLEVRGTTESEESARRILELVRKLYLVPVKDKLAVSN